MGAAYYNRRIIVNNRGKGNRNASMIYKQVQFKCTGRLQSITSASVTPQPRTVYLFSCGGKLEGNNHGTVFDSSWSVCMFNDWRGSTDDYGCVR